MNRTTVLLLALLLCVLGGFVPATARANPPMECTQGCYIIVCGSSTCSLWRCDSQGCRYLSNWPRDDSDVPLTSRRDTAKPSPSPPSVAYAKVCNRGRACELYEVTETQAVRLGHFDNVDDLVEYRESLRQPPPARRK